MIKQIKKSISGWTIPVLVCLMLMAVPALTQAWFDRGFEKEGRQESEKTQKSSPARTDEKIKVMQGCAHRASVPKPSPALQGKSLPENGPGDTWTEPVTGMEFVWVPGGCYQMGCGIWTDDCDSDETPVHEVCVDGFMIGKYEVTQGEWKTVMDRNPSGFNRGDSYPVENVSWHDCQDFIDNLNSRSNHTFFLPTEAEWEYAARSGGKKEKYAGGNDVDRVAWYQGNSKGRTHKVGTKASNGLGLYDMSGNVWEWCIDWYSQKAYARHARNNPVYDSGGYRVKRGGSWGRYSRFVRCADRSSGDSANKSRHLGFRILRKD